MSKSYASAPAGEIGVDGAEGTRTAGLHRPQEADSYQPRNSPNRIRSGLKRGPEREERVAPSSVGDELGLFAS